MNAAGSRIDSLARLRQLVLGRVRPDHDAVAARRAGRLDHVAIEVLEHRLARVAIAQQIGFDDRDNRLPRPGSSESSPACRRRRPCRRRRRCRSHWRSRRLPARSTAASPGTPSMRVGPEDHRIEEIVVDPPIEHVDLAQPVDGLHVKLQVHADQVAALDQLDAHLLREKDVLEKCGVVRTRREQRHRRMSTFRPARSRTGTAADRPDSARRCGPGRRAIRSGISRVITTRFSIT